ncbi:hypothetical protein COT27_03115 [Candidatus Kuenenbacteria bacterium CG08_land_8_20_14_0_20_37_23]|uniref:UDP-N-acetylenolpyruvoylglucosamine reductase n=2 Tax=Candidatus Kueneniibacteriota TaxID=1752740 RepID=A0A2M6XS14_9BACT|nr:MAG: UDP-N-acetylenolpyruvoylglucosamine reductase [Candidatus Kuenenbacteria bacterium CG1_02_38_13]PIU10432.1 MAG: hypothetical protein COT27_03115 [Candidatus Kuenenbacteria bacterium CG08_land_8_20_14_0_20_37_23]
MVDLIIKENYPLKYLTTMKIGGPARYFLEAKTAEDIKHGIQFSNEQNLPIFILSGGSNVLISDKGFNGIVIYNKIEGFDILNEDIGAVVLKVGAGEIWDSIVERAVKKNWWGLENMTLIPGKIGGLVVQNAGAYGCEISDVVHAVEVFDKKDGHIKFLNKKQCKFVYRDSIFKNFERRYVILNVLIKLVKNGKPKIDYPDVRRYFEKRKIQKPNLHQVRESIVYIRENKLPDPVKIGSAGSFFKNLVLSEISYDELYKKMKKNCAKESVKKLEELKNRFSGDGLIKIPTAYILDVCGLKGFVENGVKVWDSQPLVLANTNNAASAQNVLNMFKKIRQAVYKKTSIQLESEVEFIGFGRQELEEYFKLQ